MRFCFHCIAGLMVEVIADQSQRTVERALIHNTGLRPHRRLPGSYRMLYPRLWAVRSVRLPKNVHDPGSFGD